MKNFTPELIAKAKAAKSAEELLALAKENNVEMTEEQAKIYFEQLNANGTVSDDELDIVAGGLGCPDDGDDEYILKCHACGSTEIDDCHDAINGQYYRCRNCRRTFFH